MDVSTYCVMLGMRGERSVEIVMLLLAYKALCPSGIILLQ
ncbi:hypothetical protein AK812_SmicGene47992, partial [Symbiodinium microadriaticum]